MKSIIISVRDFILYTIIIALIGFSLGLWMVKEETIFLVVASIAAILAGVLLLAVGAEPRDILWWTEREDFEKKLGNTVDIPK